mmetsp:Transcript_39268/g.77256  ORF Transcript_39268/g.77256 Transcript_39268/m.77256 type:complete len:84 (-) Transcript_39268:374-625(-)
MQGQTGKAQEGLYARNRVNCNYSSPSVSTSVSIVTCLKISPHISAPFTLFFSAYYCRYHILLPLLEAQTITPPGQLAFFFCSH